MMNYISLNMSEVKNLNHSKSILIHYLSLAFVAVMPAFLKFYVGLLAPSLLRLNKKAP